MENKKNYVDGIDVSACEHYRAEIETKMPYGEYETLKDKCHYSGIEVIQNCKGNKGCIFKQLQRLQAENFELKESLKVFQRPDITKILTLYKVGDIELLEQKCDKLQAENEQIKKDYAKLHIDFAKCNEENEKLKTDIAIYKGIIDTYKEVNERLKEEITKLSDPRYQISKVNEGYYNRMNTYKQALQEIRDMATLFHSVNENKDLDRFKNNILAKINEVIGAE